MKKVISLLLCITAIVTCTTGCKKNDDNAFAVKSGEYVAGGTIPTSAKVYPIVNGDLPMTVVDEDKLLSDDDIWTLTHDVDLWATGNDTRGDGFKADEVADFADATRIQEVQDAIAAKDYDYAVDGVQILAITATSSTDVEILYVVQATGAYTAEGLAESQYEMVDTLKFKKVNENWHIAGVSELCMALSGTIEYNQDSITGTYAVKPTGDYWTWEG